MAQWNETEMLQRLQNADTQREAFAQVVRTYSERMYWVVRRVVLSHDDANDVLQNVFIKAWTNIESFKGDAKLSTWMYKIAVNESITFINRQRMHPSTSIDDADSGLLSKLESDEYFDGDELQRNFQRALLTLPEKQRLVFNMKYFDEMKYEDISAIVGTSVGALKASYHHAVQKIRAFLEQTD